MPDVAKPRPTSCLFTRSKRDPRWLIPLLTLLIAGGAIRASPSSPALHASPFTVRSQPGGATLFTPVPPEHSGIVAMNHYADPAMWAEHYQELAYGAMGTGVAAGDYDNDGRPDVFIVSKTGQSRLFRKPRRQRRGIRSEHLRYRTWIVYEPRCFQAPLAETGVVRAHKVADTRENLVGRNTRRRTVGRDLRQ
jgi:hypothetical protein